MGIGDITEAINKNGKTIVITSMVMLIVFIVVSTCVFFISLKGAEQVLVPNIVGKQLPEALLDLQARELYPRIQLRYSKKADEKGLVLEQDPSAGAVVKGGKRIELVVSQGLAVDTVQNYIGQNIDEVRNQIRNLASTHTLGGSSYLTVKQPYLTKYSEEPEGTVLEQDPPEGTPISDTMELTFVVSKGVQTDTTEVPDMLHADLKSIYQAMQKEPLTFSFIPDTTGQEAHIIVLKQDIAAHSTVPAGSPVVLTVSIPKAADGMIAGILNTTLTEFPYSLTVSLYATNPNGEKVLITTFKHPGGTCSIPYTVAEGTELSLEVLNQAIYTEVIVKAE